jgi:patatin-like phospholipase/acyl hydrolase
LREQLPWPEGKPFRILSIDGGGIRGILPAAILTALELRYLGGRSVGDYFDMIAGTSTGGIIALGLATGRPAQTILDLYVKNGRAVFPPADPGFLKMRAAHRFIKSVGHYSYDSAVLQQRLSEIFGDKTLGDTRRRLCIPSFDGFTEVNIFKTPHHPDYRRDWCERLLTVAMATAAAPTYFPVYRDKGRVFADGGVWANNPVMIGVVDALTCYRLDRRQVHILSLGTGDTDIKISDQQVRLGGLWHWRDIMSSAMHLQSQNADGQAGLLIGRDQLIRLNARPKDPIKLDDYARARTELLPIASSLVDEFGDRISDQFLFAPVEDYAAYHGPRAAP